MALGMHRRGSAALIPDAAFYHLENGIFVGPNVKSRPGQQRATNAVTGPIEGMCDTSDIGAPGAGSGGGGGGPVPTFFYIICNGSANEGGDYAAASTIAHKLFTFDIPTMTLTERTNALTGKLGHIYYDVVTDRVLYTAGPSTTGGNHASIREWNADHSQSERATLAVASASAPGFTGIAKFNGGWFVSGVADIVGPGDTTRVWSYDGVSTLTPDFAMVTGDGGGLAGNPDLTVFGTANEFLCHPTCLASDGNSPGYSRRTTSGIWTRTALADVTIDAGGGLGETAGVFTVDGKMYSLGKTIVGGSGVIVVFDGTNAPTIVRTGYTNLGLVRAIKTFNNKLYILASWGSSRHEILTKFDGVTWTDTEFDFGVSGDGSPTAIQVNDLIAVGGDIYAVGYTGTTQKGRIWKSNGADTTSFSTVIDASTTLTRFRKVAGR